MIEGFRVQPRRHQQGLEGDPINNQHPIGITEGLLGIAESNPEPKRVPGPRMLK